MNIGDIIKSRRLELGLTLEKVGTAVGVGKSTVRKWESGQIKDMRRDKIAALATVLRISPAVLILGDPDIQTEIPDNIIPFPDMDTVPLLGEIACGEPILAEENIVDYVKMPKEASGSFALRCRGDSMINARIFDGDLVFVRQQPDVENGEIAAVLIGSEATLKKVYKFPDKLVLSPCNPMYEDLVYRGDELGEIRILGKAVAFTSFVR